MGVEVTAPHVADRQPHISEKLAVIAHGLDTVLLLGFGTPCFLLQPVAQHEQFYS